MANTTKGRGGVGTAKRKTITGKATGKRVAASNVKATRVRRAA